MAKRKRSKAKPKRQPNKPIRKPTNVKPQAKKKPKANKTGSRQSLSSQGSPAKSKAKAKLTKQSPVKTERKRIKSYLRKVKVGKRYRYQRVKAYYRNVKPKSKPTPKPEPLPDISPLGLIDSANRKSELVDTIAYDIVGTTHDIWEIPNNSEEIARLMGEYPDSGVMSTVAFIDEDGKISYRSTHAYATDATTPDAILDRTLTMVSKYQSVDKSLGKPRQLMLSFINGIDRTINNRLPQSNMKVHRNVKKVKTRKGNRK